MKRFLKYTLITLLALPLLAAAFLWGLYLTADMEPPAMTVDTAAYRVADHGGYTSCRGSFLRHNRFGLWELYTAGSPEESGAAAGALTAGLMRYQEQVFVDQIREFIPSDGYLKFLRGMIVIFNRNLGRHVPEEYRREIYARSLYCSHDFDAIGMALAERRVGALFLVKGKILPGGFDINTGTVTFDGDPNPVDDGYIDPAAPDITDAFAQAALAQDAHIYIVEQNQMPTDKSVAALFRYAE